MTNKRVLFVEIETIDRGKKELKRLDGLAIKGTINRKMSAVQSEARISIANLAKSDIEYLSTSTSPYVRPTVKKKINIYAGYTQTGWGRIFTGDIYSALPSDIPDTWLNIEAKSISYQSRVPLTYGVANSTTQKIGKSISQSLGLNFEWQSQSKKSIDIFNVVGSKSDLIKRFNELDDFTMFEDNGKLVVIDKIIKPTGNTKLISKDTGMIGIPELNEKGIKVTTLLDPSLNIGSWIQTKSVKYPSSNGIYQIYDLSFDFANRETQFYSVIEAKTQGIR